MSGRSIETVVLVRRTVLPLASEQTRPSKGYGIDTGSLGVEEDEESSLGESSRSIL